MKSWGDGVARAFLGVLALGLLASAVANWWIGSSAFAGPLLVVGLILAIVCAFFRSISGEVDYPRIKIRFSGPDRHIREPVTAPNSLGTPQDGQSVADGHVPPDSN